MAVSLSMASDNSPPRESYGSSAANELSGASSRCTRTNGCATPISWSRRTSSSRALTISVRF